MGWGHRRREGEDTWPANPRSAASRLKFGRGRGCIRRGRRVGWGRGRGCIRCANGSALPRPHRGGRRRQAEGPTVRLPPTRTRGQTAAADYWDATLPGASRPAGASRSAARWRPVASRRWCRFMCVLAAAREQWGRRFARSTARWAGARCARKQGRGAEGGRREFYNGGRGSGGGKPDNSTDGPEGARCGSRKARA